MSFYRKLIVAVAALGLATSVFAADESTTSSTTDSTSTTQAAPADAAAAPADAAAAAPADTKTTETTTNETTTTTDKVDLNKASAKELMKVKGLNAAKAKAIVTYRKKHGDFKSVDELKDVKGFKKLDDKKMQEIADQLTVG